MANLQYAEVTCTDCGKEYVCTPSQDYFHTKEQTADPEFEKLLDNGYCWDCFMKVTGMKPQPEPPYTVD
jgi:hypothetical protein